MGWLRLVSGGYLVVEGVMASEFIRADNVDHMAAEKENGGLHSAFATSELMSFQPLIKSLMGFKHEEGEGSTRRLLHKEPVVVPTGLRDEAFQPKPNIISEVEGSQAAEEQEDTTDDSPGKASCLLLVEGAPELNGICHLIGEVIKDTNAMDAMHAIGERLGQTAGLKSTAEDTHATPPGETTNQDEEEIGDKMAEEWLLKAGRFLDNKDGNDAELYYAATAAVGLKDQPYSTSEVPAQMVERDDTTEAPEATGTQEGMPTDKEEKKNVPTEKEAYDVAMEFTNNLAADMDFPEMISSYLGLMLVKAKKIGITSEHFGDAMVDARGLWKTLEKSVVSKIADGEYTDEKTLNSMSTAFKIAMQKILSDGLETGENNPTEGGGGDGGEGVEMGENNPTGGDGGDR
eukprot:GHVS01073468.1.p1 GENE.GHVS01073468.1~~GHVS01073468.1.p1  ORF type:complete len:403 (+),score=82.69 GHVS01073468.1:3-1211(+)